MFGTPGRLGAAALVISLAACGQSATEPTPLPLLPPPAVPPPAVTFTVSGTVFEHTATGTRPGAFVPLVVRSWGRSPVVASAISDANGHYEAGGLPGNGDAISIAPPVDSGYRAPCPSGTSGLKSHGAFDVHVVSTTLLASAGAPESLPRGAVIFAGVVFENSSDGRALPIAGATVDLTAKLDPTVMSSTVTDHAGRYFACSIPPGAGTDQAGWLRAAHEAYQPAAREAFPDTWTDIVLVRK